MTCPEIFEGKASDEKLFREEGEGTDNQKISE